MNLLLNFYPSSTYIVDDKDVSLLDSHVKMVHSGSHIHFSDPRSSNRRAANHVKLDMNDVNTSRSDNKLINVVLFNCHHCAQLTGQLSEL